VKCQRRNVGGWAKAGRYFLPTSKSGWRGSPNCASQSAPKRLSRSTAAQVAYEEAEVPWFLRHPPIPSSLTTVEMSLRRLAPQLAQPWLFAANGIPR